MKNKREDYFVYFNGKMVTGIYDQLDDAIEAAKGLLRRGWYGDNVIPTYSVAWLANVRLGRVDYVLTDDANGITVHDLQKH